MTAIPIELKWGKKTIPQLEIIPGSSTDAFKEQIQSITGVPMTRQKLLCKGGWKGMLGDGTKFDENLSLPSGKKLLVVTLIGSAEALPEPPPVPTKFIEDLPTEERTTRTLEQEMAMTKSKGMIAALQKEPLRRDDDIQKSEMYHYNRLVTGLPQRQIEDRLREKEKQGKLSSSLTGEVVMTLGLQLRRAYINVLTVLPSSGTLLSGLDDGHIMAWRHGEQLYDVIHEGGDGGVDCMVPLDHPRVAFATGGRGCVRLWTADGGHAQGLGCPPGMSPNSLVTMNLSSTSGAGGKDRSIVCIASSFRITRQSNPNQFRLVPQDEAGRRRRAEAEAQEAMIQESLNRWSRCVSVWYTGNDSTSSPLQSFVLKPEDHDATAAPVATVAVLPDNKGDGGVARLVCGDNAGGLRFWNVRMHNNNGEEEIQQQQTQLVQLHPPNSEVASVVCMEPLPNSPLLAVSTERGMMSRSNAIGNTNNNNSHTILNLPTSRAVFLLDFDKYTVHAILDAHKDTVQCIMPLPNGGLVTGGGKMDATLKLWEHEQFSQADDNQDNGDGDMTMSDAITTTDNNEGLLVLSEATKELKDVGYSLALAVLPDSIQGSNHFALSAVRYNVVKICL